MTAISTLCFCAALVLPGFAGSQWTLAASLCAIGLGAGAMDVAMNAHGVAVERAAGRPLMSGFHALFSIGGMAGSALGGGVAGSGIEPRPHFIAGAFIASAIALAAIRGLLPGSVDRVSRQRARLRISRTLLGLSALAFCFFLGEGAIADWSALYLNRFTGAPAGRAAAGYAVFSAAMAIGRLSGDALRKRFRPTTLVRTGSMTAAVGLTIALAAPVTSIALLGFAVVGAGCAVVVPIVFAATGGLGASGAGAALAMVTTCGYLGLFAGPPAIGFAAEAYTLRVAPGLVVALIAGGAVLASNVAGAAIGSREEPVFVPDV